MEKINWLLILQGWAMLWVVIGHSPLGAPGEGPEWENVLYYFAYSFHMPLFMLVSGWLFYITRLKLNGGGQKWNYPAVLKDKALRLLLPGLIFSILALVIKVAFPSEVSRQTELNFHEIVHSYLYPYDNPLRELWFIVTLFWFFVLTPFWKTVINNDYSKWVCLVILIIIHFLNVEIDLLCFGRVLNYAIWFYLGILISKENWVDRIVAKYPLWVFVVGIIIYIVGKYSNVFVATIGGIIFSFAIAVITDKFVPKLFWSFRNYTYQIFLMGIFAQILVKIIYRHIEMPYLVTYLICILAGLYIPVLISKLLEWINIKPILLCVGLKQNKKDK